MREHLTGCMCETCDHNRLFSHGIIGNCEDHADQELSPYFIVTITISAGEDNGGWEGAARDLVILTDTLRSEWAYEVDIGGV